MKKTIFVFILLAFLPFAAFSKNDGGGDSVGSGSSASTAANSSVGYNYNISGYDGELKKILNKLEDEKDYKGSIKSLEKYVYENPKNPDGWNLIGFVSRKLERFDDAEIYYANGLEISPNHDDIIAYQGQLFLETNRYHMALENLEKLTSLCSFNCDEKIELSNAIKAYEKKNNL